MVKIKNKLFMVFSILFAITLVSANGLVISPSDITINQTIGLPNSYIMFNVTNSEPIDFSNIQSNSPYITFPQFNLSSGQTATIKATIVASVSFSGQVSIKGFYQANQGQTAQTHNVIISSTNGSFVPNVDVCSFSLYQGDSVGWQNTFSQDVQIISSSGSIITSIPSQGTQSFMPPSTFTYRLGESNIPFGPLCTVTVLSTTGLINNPDYDGKLNLNILVQYPPTNLSVYILTDSYTISAGSSAGDVMSIKNNGSTVAHNVTISGQWFTTITPNNFDLQPGESRNIGYTIKPNINNTSQTNQTYNISLNIADSNNDNYQHFFSVTIPYAIVNATTPFQSNLTLDQLATQSFNFLQAYCNDNSNALITSASGSITCAQLFNNAASDTSTQCTSSDVLVNGILGMLNQNKEFITFLKNSNDGQNITNNETLFYSKLCYQYASTNKEDNQNLTNAIYVLAIVLAFAIIGFVLLQYGIPYLAKIKIDKMKGHR